MGTLARPEEIKALFEGMTDYGRDYSWTVPEGFKELGSGISRKAFRGPSGTVYKVPFSTSDSLVSDNEFEAFTYHASTEFASRVERYRFNGITILAMEYVENVAPLGEWYGHWEATHQCDDECLGLAYGASIECNSRTYANMTLAQRATYREMAQYFGDLHEYNIAITNDGTLKLLDGGEPERADFNVHHVLGYRRVH